MKLGIEVLSENPELSRSWGRCALLCNQASMTHHFLPAWEVCRQALGSRLAAFLGPQHGFHATVQDNMIESEHSCGPYGLPVYSLYSETREPTNTMLDGIDTIVIDLQIVGCRVYTFKYTIAGCLRAAKKYGKKVVILDRPNPLGGQFAEGRVLDESVYSFVGEFAIPLRHGLSVGEAAQFFNRSIGAPLEIIQLENWDYKKIWHETGRSWVLTSPNLPTPESVYVYPATVLLEGTNISEGRGTTLPFQLIGAPYINNAESYIHRVQEIFKADLGGIFLRPSEFQPTYQKWQGKSCRGFQIHFLEPTSISMFRFGLAVIRAAIELGGEAFAWKQPPYEYEYQKLPINLLIGAANADQKLMDTNFDITDQYWFKGLESYCRDIGDCLIYPRNITPLY